MCTVQVLISADVMRFGRNRRNVIMRPNRESICRKLFCEQPSEAEADPQAVLKRIQEGINAQAAQRWNFDFLKGEPLPGRYQWVPVGAGPTSDQIEEAVVAEVKTVQTQTEPEEKSTEKEAGSCTQTKQSKITDYMNNRKRRNSTSVSPKLKTRRSNKGNAICNTTTTTDSSSSSSSSSSVSST